MDWLRFRPDPIDAVMAPEASDADLADVAALVHDVRSAYLPDDGLRRSPELAAFAGSEPLGDAAAAVGPTRPSVASTRASRPSTPARIAAGVAAVVATTTGKIMLGTAVAAASLGGMHAAEVLDVPLLPDRQPSDVAPTDPAAEPPFELTETAPGTPPGVTDSSSASAGIARRPVAAPSEGPADPSEVVDATPAPAAPGDRSEQTPSDRERAPDVPGPDGRADPATPPPTPPADAPADPPAPRPDGDHGPATDQPESQPQEPQPEDPETGNPEAGDPATHTEPPPPSDHEPGGPSDGSNPR